MPLNYFDLCCIKMQSLIIILIRSKTKRIIDLTPPSPFSLSLFYLGLICFFRIFFFNFWRVAHILHIFFVFEFFMESFALVWIQSHTHNNSKLYKIFLVCISFCAFSDILILRRTLQNLNKPFLPDVFCELVLELLKVPTLWNIWGQREQHLFPWSLVTSVHLTLIMTIWCFSQKSWYRPTDTKMGVEHGSDRTQIALVLRGFNLYKETQILLVWLNTFSENWRDDTLKFW